MGLFDRLINPNIIDAPCPKCGRKLMIIKVPVPWGSVVCTNPDCGWSERIGGDDKGGKGGCPVAMITH